MSKALAVMALAGMISKGYEGNANRSQQNQLVWKERYFKKNQNFLDRELQANLAYSQRQLVGNV